MATIKSFPTKVIVNAQLPPSSFVPPYTLPGPGQVSLISVQGGNTAKDVKPPGWSDQEINYSLFGSFGSGCFAEQFSQAGAYCFGPTGGHQHPDFTGVCLFDFTTGKWSLLEHQNGGTKYSPGDLWFDLSEINEDPYREIKGTSQVPAPGHPYQQSVYLPPAMGGGTKGSVIVMRHGTLGAGGLVMSHSIHRFDLATARWSRATNSLLRSGKGSE